MTFSMSWMRSVPRFRYFLRTSFFGFFTFSPALICTYVNISFFTSFFVSVEFSCIRFVFFNLASFLCFVLSPILLLTSFSLCR